MTGSPIATALGRRFAAALRQMEPRQARIGLERYISAFIAAEPALATSPERRGRLVAAIDELIEAGVIRTSRSVDGSESPPIPRFLVLLERSADPPVGREAAGYPWRPELAWAARLPLRRSEFDALRAIQAFLRDRSDDHVIPTGERSLEVFGDEKRLDKLRRNRRMFQPGRLSLEMLGTRLYAPPFVWRRIGSGPVALVLENVATYRSVLTTILPGGPVGLVVFGGGASFSASVAYFAELATEGPAAAITDIRYFGDLDRRGLETPIAANVVACESGLPPVRPAVGLWNWLLRMGKRKAHSPVKPATAERLTLWLPPPLRSNAHGLLVSGNRLAQEAVGTKLLASDPAWFYWEGLG